MICTPFVVFLVYTLHTGRATTIVRHPISLYRPECPVYSVLCQRLGTSAVPGLSSALGVGSGEDIRKEGSQIICDVRSYNG